MKALSISNLCKTYNNGLQALKNISFEVEQGDFFALLGANGAGKSTCIGIITSLVNKTSGQVAVFNNDLDVNPEAVKSYIGLVPQEYNFNIFEPIEEIILNQAGYYGIERKVAYARTEHCLKQLDLWDKRREVPRELSGGMKRRLMIARALVHEPKLLILDEPTAGVDIQIRHSMWSFLQQINAEGTTIILTTHYLEEAEFLCRNIAIIDEGNIVENTSMNSLLSRLQCETFILNIKDSIDVAPELEYFPLRLVGVRTFEVDIYEGRNINDLFHKLSNVGIEVLSMRNKSNRLEQLFLSSLKRQ